MATDSPDLKLLAGELVENRTFSHRYPALTQALRQSLHSDAQADVANTVADPAGDLVPNISSRTLSDRAPHLLHDAACNTVHDMTDKTTVSKQHEGSSQDPMMFEMAGNHGLTVTDVENHDSHPGSLFLQHNEIKHGAAPQLTSSIQPPIDQFSSVGVPLSGMNEEQTPLYFAKQLAAITNRYVDTIQKRNTIKHFYDVHKSATQMPQSGILFKSRLQRIAEINRPTSSLLFSGDASSTLPIRSTEEVPLLAPATEFHMYPEGGRALSTLLSAQKPRGPLVARELVHSGIQSMPKLNPGRLFQKESCDMAAIHLSEQAMAMMHRSAESERQIGQFFYDMESKGYETAGANPVLRELSMTQKNLMTEQERKRDELAREVYEMASEHDTISRHARRDFYEYLFAPTESPENLRYYRDRARALAKGPSRPYVAPKSIQERRKIINSSRYGLGVDDVDKTTGRVSSQGLKKLLERFKFSKYPVSIDDHWPSKTQFPGVYPRSMYKQTQPRRSVSLSSKKRWEEMGSPSFSTIQRARDGKWTEGLETKELKFEKGRLKREAREMRKQLETRMEEDDWELYLQQHQDEMEVRKKQMPVFIVDDTLMRRESQEVKSEMGITESSREQMKFDGGPLRTERKIETQETSKTVEMKDVGSAEKLEKAIPSIVKKDDLRPPIQIVVSKPVEKRGVLSKKTDLVRRIPRLYCQEYVELNYRGTPEPLNVLHDQSKRAVAQRRLGLPTTAQLMYDLSQCCISQQVSESELAKELSNILTEGLVYYPLQLDLLSAGIAALRSIYEAYPNKALLTESYVECYTTLLAIDDSVLRAELINSLATVMQNGKTETTSTDLVDLLLACIAGFDNQALTRDSLIILSAARIGHRKADQYTLFIGCLEYWRHEPVVLVYACLAVDSFAKRAEAEGRRARIRDPDQSPVRSMTRKILASQEDETGKLKMTGLLRPVSQEINEKPVSWMPQDGSDVAAIARIMKLHQSHRKLIGAACTALSSLVKCSDLQAQAITKKAWGSLIDVSKEISDSVAISISVLSILESLALTQSTRAFVSNVSSVRVIISMISQHSKSAQVISAGTSALVALGSVLHSCIEVFDVTWLSSVINTANEEISTPEVASAVCSFIALLAPSKQLIDMQQALTSAGGSDFCLEALKACSADAKTCEVAARGLARLVYKNEEAKLRLKDQPVCSVLMLVLMKHRNDSNVIQVALNALKCCINCEIISTPRLEPGQLEVVEELCQRAMETKNSAVLAEIDNLVKEISRQDGGIPIGVRECYHRLVALLKSRAKQLPSSTK